VNRSDFRWVTPPGVIANALGRRIGALPGAIFLVGVAGASRIESAMREIGPWTDRTTEARSGLTGEAQRDGENTVIYGYHTAPHGIFLELGTVKMPPHEAVVPAFAQESDDIVRIAAGVARRVLLGGA
jgi:HK97 gp10 family phage protein